MDGAYRPGVRDASRLAALVAAVLVLLVAPPGDGAGAHAYLTDTVPATGAELDGSPSEIVLTYDAPVAPAGNALTVVDEEGDEHRLDAAEGAAPGQIRASLRDELEPGVHRVVWRVLPADGHVLEGDFTFTVASEPPRPEGAESVAASEEPRPVTTERSPVPTGSAATVAGAMSDVTAMERAEVAGAVGGDGNWAGALALLVAVGIVAAGLVRRGRRATSEVVR